MKRREFLAAIAAAVVAPKMTPPQLLTAPIELPWLVSGYVSAEPCDDYIRGIRRTGEFSFTVNFDDDLVGPQQA